MHLSSYDLLAAALIIQSAASVFFAYSFLNSNDRLSDICKQLITKDNIELEGTKDGKVEPYIKEK